jgi:hypothetical protein
MCGTIQLTVDILIILQIISYKKVDSKMYTPVSIEGPVQIRYEGE